MQYGETLSGGRSEKLWIGLNTTLFPGIFRRIMGAGGTDYRKYDFILN